MLIRRVYQLLFWMLEQPFDCIGLWKWLSTKDAEKN